MPEFKFNLQSSSRPAPAKNPNQAIPISAVAIAAPGLCPDPVVFLTADKLLLPDVPEHARESVREFLRPFLPSIPVKNGDCWNIAQRLTLLANSPRVGYVEGVWTRPAHHLEHLRSECDCEDFQKDRPIGSPHAWNTVDGHLVDLVVEFKFIGWTPEDDYWSPSEWWHEPLKSYSLEDLKKYEFARAYLKKYFKKHAKKKFRKLLLQSVAAGFSITPVICFQGWGADFGMTFTEEDETADDENHVFKPANERFVARVNEWLQQQQQENAQESVGS